MVVFYGLYFWCRWLFKGNFKISKNKHFALDRDNYVTGKANKFKRSILNQDFYFLIKFSQLDLVSTKKFDAIIFDLGLSSIQLDDLSRGFSFKSKNELNMSMGQTEDCKEVLNNYSYKDLKENNKNFRDEGEATKIAKNISYRAKIHEITTTDELVQIIKRSKKKNYKKKIDESTKTFQAIKNFC